MVAFTRINLGTFQESRKVFLLVFYRYTVSVLLVKNILTVLHEVATTALDKEVFLV